MYINPFAAGVLTTLLVEFGLLVVVAICFMEKRDGKDE